MSDSRMKRMDPAVKSEWLAALRGGDYMQTKGSLRSEFGYCCLGVLTDIWAEENSVEWSSLSAIGARSISTDGSYLESSVAPAAIVKWSKLENSTGTMRIATLKGFDEFDHLRESELVVSLSGLNDDGLTFDQIADIIEYAL